MRTSQAHGRRRSTFVQSSPRVLLLKAATGRVGPARRRRRRTHLYPQRASPDCVRLSPCADSLPTTVAPRGAAPLQCVRDAAVSPEGDGLMPVCAARARQAWRGR